MHTQFFVHERAPRIILRKRKSVHANIKFVEPWAGPYFRIFTTRVNPELWILLTKELYLVTNQAKSILFDHLTRTQFLCEIRVGHQSCIRTCGTILSQSSFYTTWDFSYHHNICGSNSSLDLKKGFSVHEKEYRH